MAQEMYKHEALLHLVWAIANADEPITNVWSNQISDEEKEYFDRIAKAEGIEINFSDFIDKRISLGDKYGWDSIIEEALKATNGCAREWRTKVYGYMWSMALESWEGGYNCINDERKMVSEKEMEIIRRAKAYFSITPDEDDKAMSLTKV